MKLKTAVVGLSASLMLSTLSWAAGDGASLYKSKCAGCHGTHGQGKPAMKAPALKGTSLDAGQIADKISKGSAGAKAPHNKGINGVTADQASAIAEYVKTLK